MFADQPISTMRKPPSNADYDGVEQWCRAVVKAGHPLLFSPTVFTDELDDASVKFNMPVESLHSFLRNIHLIHVKKNSHMLRNNVQAHVEDYVSGNMSILDMARAMNYPPYHVARTIVEHVANLTDGTGGAVSSSRNSGNKKAVTEAMREPWRKLGDPSVLKPEYQSSENHRSNTGDESLSPISRLATEVIEAMKSDPLYGPKQDRERHSVGLEHEEILEKALEAMKIPFETENDLRIKGTSRTPDVLLSCPVGMKVPKRSSTRRKLSLGNNSCDIEEDIEEEYEWKVVCWIDSKALFGDVQTHNNSVLPQAESFVHRFGPGLILYWFGHAPIERLGDGHGDVLVTGWKLPNEFMLPTGKIARAASSSPDNNLQVQINTEQDETIAKN
mmetsp:Transcript_32486/g.71310  ORF Transcript_32486/g.71310 Transcript_32486/m.71310 type:complete len:388 (+) Transcript_32486:41-1204(+)